MRNRFAAALGLVLALAVGTASVRVAIAANGSVTVTVLDAGGAAVPGARVCLGTPTSRTANGIATTNSSGIAAFPNAPSGSFTVTASAGTLGASTNMTGGTAALTVTLRIAAGGPTCSDTVLAPLPQGAAVPGSGTVVLPTPIQITRPPTQTLPVHSPVLTLQRHTCFGALGADCGGAQFGLPVAALCTNGQCSINGGSWLHDECCVAHQHGMACQLGPLDQFTGNDGHCVVEWNRATSRLNYTWSRRVDFNKVNTTGTVVFEDYCAQPGSRVHVDDVRFCCSRRAHVEQVASKFADPNVRVCD